MYKKIALIIILASVGSLVFLGLKSELTQNKLFGLFRTGKTEALPVISELLPPPLTKRLPAAKVGETIEQNEVITITNEERQAQGLPSLRENQQLNLAAEEKINDMIKNQYFEHESPDGKGPSDLAKAAGYEFVLVGENLAEGDFLSSRDLVTGWMESPGHRANILNQRFEEIGVAVRYDVLFGKKVWIAVQEFGRPLSSCPQIDQALKTSVDQDQIMANSAEAELRNLLEVMNDAKYRGDTANYNSYVPIYNQKVSAYNALVDKIKNNVALYNQSVKDFNSCLNQ